MKQQQKAMGPLRLALLIAAALHAQLAAAIVARQAGAPAAALAAPAALRAGAAVRVASAGGALEPGTPAHPADLQRTEQGQLISALHGMLAAGGQEAGRKQEHPAGPLNVQIPQEELEEFVGLLSPQCGKQYTAMIEGTGAAMHTFSAGGASPAGRCEGLNGTLCAATAKVTSEQTAGGITRHFNAHAKGDSCLPGKCTSGEDLAALVDFMRSKALASLGAGSNLTMQVDCSAAGGGTVAAAGLSAGLAQVQVGARKPVRIGNVGHKSTSSQLSSSAHLFALAAAAAAAATC